MTVGKRVPSEVSRMLPSARRVRRLTENERLRIRSDDELEIMREAEAAVAVENRRAVDSFEYVHDPLQCPVERGSWWTDKDYE